MAIRTQNSTGRTIAVIAGGALLAWMLWRGRGKGSGSAGKGSGEGGDHNNALAAVEIWVRSNDRIDLDGARSDLSTVIEHARAAGVARVLATGDARQGWIAQVIAALRATGVVIDAAPSLLH